MEPIEPMTPPLTLTQYCIYLVFKAIHFAHNWASTVIHWFLFPWAWVFYFYAQIFQQLGVVINSIANKICDLLNVIPCTFKLWFWFWECALTYWCAVETMDETRYTLTKKIYPKLETILLTFGLIPLPEEVRKALNYILEIGMDIADVPLPEFITNPNYKPPAKDSKKKPLLPSDPNKNSSPNLPGTSEPNNPAKDSEKKPLSPSDPNKNSSPDLPGTSEPSNPAKDSEKKPLSPSDPNKSSSPDLPGTSEPHPQE